MNVQSKLSLAKGPLRFWITGVLSFLLFGAICGYIAYDNRLISPNDTKEELIQHTEELKIVLTESVLGGGLLGAVFSVAALFLLPRPNNAAKED